ncbi:hypothetical protein BP5796_04912 [Coleophoma crateriformis]|uniref:Uncharacterized protein n=1 Tax=Coleophoma crateriformis TaxID=565419 RepID=A0A3D8SB84_9HELO|nr:hypothetical protein BP5796_04912 [Coleophoma crateriformis]
MSSPALSSALAPVVKRGRGRPRKVDRPLNAVANKGEKRTKKEKAGVAITPPTSVRRSTRAMRSSEKKIEDEQEEEGQGKKKKWTEPPLAFASPSTRIKEKDEDGVIYEDRAPIKTLPESPTTRMNHEYSGEKFLGCIKASDRKENEAIQTESKALVWDNVRYYPSPPQMCFEKDRAIIGAEAQIVSIPASTSPAYTAINREEKRGFYFAYDEDMDTSFLQSRHPSARLVGAAKLADYKFVINEAGFAAIVSHKGSQVYGILFSVLASALANMEGELVVEGMYEKACLEVEMVELGLNTWGHTRLESDRELAEATGGLGDGEVIRALVCVSSAEVKEPGAIDEELIPYMNRAILEGLAEGFPDVYVEELRKVVPRPVAPWNMGGRKNEKKSRKSAEQNKAEEVAGKR